MERPTKSFDLVRLFAALADRTRLRLLNLMRDREVCVCYFVEILRQGQPKISRHLAYLRKAGIVSARREGRWMHYRIEWPQNAKASAILDQPGAWEDPARLRRALELLEAANRASEAARTAVSSPLLESSVEGATGILLNITGPPDLGLFEVNEAAEVVTGAADQNANVIFGAVVDDKHADQVRVTVIATGFGTPRSAKRRRTSTLLTETPPARTTPSRPRERESWCGP